MTTEKQKKFGQDIKKKKIQGCHEVIEVVASSNGRPFRDKTLKLYERAVQRFEEASNPIQWIENRNVPLLALACGSLNREDQKELNLWQTRIVKLGLIQDEIFLGCCWINGEPRFEVKNVILLAPKNEKPMGYSQIKRIKVWLNLEQDRFWLSTGGSVPFAENPEYWDSKDEWKDWEMANILSDGWASRPKECCSKLVFVWKYGAKAYQFFS